MPGVVGHDSRQSERKVNRPPADFCGVGMIVVAVVVLDSEGGGAAATGVGTVFSLSEIQPFSI